MILSCLFIAWVCQVGRTQNYITENDTGGQRNTWDAGRNNIKWRWFCKSTTNIDKHLYLEQFKVVHCKINLDIFLSLLSLMQVVSSNPAHDKVYFIQHYVMKFVSDLRSVVFSGHSDSFINKTDRHDITEILLKVALTTINLT